MIYVISFIIGLVFGSFGSVILARLSEHITRKSVRSVLVGRSHCPHCKHTLAWYDLFPLASWLSTKGTCRYCHAKISHRYPLLEVGVGLVFMAITYWWMLYGGGDLGVLALFLFTSWSLYLLIVYDIETLYLHPVARWMSVIGTAGLLLYKTDGVSFLTAVQWMFVFAIGFVIFYFLAKIYVRLRRKQDAEGIGQGDVMLAPIVGIILWKVASLVGIVDIVSWMRIVEYFWHYVIASCVASLILLLVIPMRKEEGKSILPFLPGMIVGIGIMMVVISVGI